MTTIRLTTEQIADKMLSSYRMYKEGFKTEDDHLNFCDAINRFFGNEVYDEACEIAEQKSVKLWKILL